MHKINLQNTIGFPLLLALLLLPVYANVDPSQKIIQMLDYMGVDYPNTVKNEKVIDPVEYREMQEFSAEVLNLMKQMPEIPEKPSLLSSASDIQKAIEEKQNGKQVAAKTAPLKQALINSYEIVVGPNSVPDMEKVNILFESQCASCHGMAGDGNGPLAKTLSPSPSNFHDMERQHSRSVYDLYNTISLGVAGTPMPSYAALSDEQRWGLAFYISQFSATDEQREKGRTLWNERVLRDSFPTLSDLTKKSYAHVEHEALSQNLDKTQATSILAYLRNQPKELDVSVHAAIDKTLLLLTTSLERARSGDKKGAYSAALSAYLDGFELAEPSLLLADKPLTKRIEIKMIAFRELAKRSSRAESLLEMEKTHHDLVALLEQAKTP